MQKHFLKFRKLFTSIACSPLILISNNSELAAKYLPKDLTKSIITYESANVSVKKNFFTRISTVATKFLAL